MKNEYCTLSAKVSVCEEPMVLRLAGESLVNDLSKSDPSHELDSSLYEGFVRILRLREYVREIHVDGKRIKVLHTESIRNPYFRQFWKSHFSQILGLDTYVGQKGSVEQAVPEEQKIVQTESNAIATTLRTNQSPAEAFGPFAENVRAMRSGDPGRIARQMSLRVHEVRVSA